MPVDSSSSPSSSSIADSPLMQQQQQQQPSPTSTVTSIPPMQTKKKHVCPTCERGFTTSGHLARHSRVHTGERNHKCPFPGCETRCSRQDNLQQHYRIHLSPGSRRTSARSAVSRAMKRGAQSNANVGGQTTIAPPPSVHPSIESILPPVNSPPALEPARHSYASIPPPDSPPPLAQATVESLSRRSSVRPPSQSPEMSYTVQTASMGAYNYAPYAGRSGPTSYQDQSAPYSAPSYDSAQDAYSNQQYSDHQHATNGGHYHQSSPHIPHHAHHDPSPPHVPSSRHSISHISHPNYSQPHPPSPSHSHGSTASSSNGPPTPQFQSTYDGYQGLHHQYSSSTTPTGAPRAESPPPILAPIHATAHPGMPRRDSYGYEYGYHHHHQTHHHAAAAAVQQQSQQQQQQQQWAKTTGDMRVGPMVQ